MTTIPEYDLDALAALEEKATSGDWQWGITKSGREIITTTHREENRFAEGGYICPTVFEADVHHVGYGGCDVSLEFREEADKDLICAARNALPAMIRDLREAGEVLREVEWSLTDTYGFHCPWCFGYRPGESVAMQYRKSLGHTPDCRLDALLKRIGRAG